jgi:hypothetical protein
LNKALGVSFQRKKGPIARRLVITRASGIWRLLKCLAASAGGAIGLTKIGKIPSGPMNLLRTGILVLKVICAAEINRVIEPMNIQNSLELKASSEGLLGKFFQWNK